MEMNVERTKVMRLSKATIPNKNYDRSKQLENVEYFSYLGSMITNDARCVREIKPELPDKSSIQQKEDPSHQQIGLKFKEETIKVPHLEHVWC
jgi:hypothetical protein